MLLALTLIQLALAAGSYPLHPDPFLTPGSLCIRADTYRYPERIAYCVRNVETNLKNDIIDQYEEAYDFTILPKQRSSYKIDHYIPLCMGGSNERTNLWPQHKSVYKVTDPLEPMLCKKMAEGRLRQQEAIDLIRKAKNNLELVNSILIEVERL